MHPLSDPMDNLSLPIHTQISTSLLFQEEVMSAIEAMTSASVEERGAIFTRPDVVDFILDLAGYTPDKPLDQMKILEPSFGNGNFLLPMVERLLQAWNRAANKSADTFEDLSMCVCAVELHGETFIRTKRNLLYLLCEHGIPADIADRLTHAWLILGDFLLSSLPQGFDFIVGNPPYVRQERIPTVLLSAYREQYSTLYDRADLYIPFIERSLRLLVPNGHLAFICSDRWTKNRYGSLLRKLVSKHYHLKIYVDMVDTPAFHSEVSAYPSIAVIARQAAGATRFAEQPEINKATLKDLANALVSPQPPSLATVREIKRVTNEDEPWIFDQPNQLELVRRLERIFPTLEKEGCKVGIGIATGADEAFIGPFDSLSVEPSRKLPLVTTQDIASGEVRWNGLGLVNPYEEDGSLVKLENYPLLQRYLEERKNRIANRHCARKSPNKWYRTIDRINLDLTAKPKLLIPDIKGEAHIVYDAGEFYPHHNLYYITSSDWDLRALQTVLRTGIARLFVSVYSTRMRGGYLRFQAQYLRRIRIPRWQDVPDQTKRVLIKASIQKETLERAVFDLYGLTSSERATLGTNKK